MIEAGDIPKTSLANFKSEAIMHWDSVFKLDKLRASRQVKINWEFHSLWSRRMVRRQVSTT